jgi:glycerate kinase
MLTAEELTSIIRNVARDQGRTLDVHSVAATDGGSGRAEILVTVAGCHTDPCRLLINVTRETAAAFEADFRTKISSALERHRAGGNWEMD